MTYTALLAPPAERSLLWLGGAVLYAPERRYRVVGNTPATHGWWTFKVGGGRFATLLGAGPSDPAFERVGPHRQGWLVGDRLILDDARVEPDGDLFTQTRHVHLVEPGLARFERVAVVELPEGMLVYLWPLLPLGPESAVEVAYVERLETVDGIRGVPPGLDLAFRFVSQERAWLEARREVLRVAREAQARHEAAVQQIGTGAGRRALAATDFQAAAQAALAVGGAAGHNSQLPDSAE